VVVVVVCDPGRVCVYVCVQTQNEPCANSGRVCVCECANPGRTVCKLMTCVCVCIQTQDEPCENSGRTVYKRRDSYNIQPLVALPQGERSRSRWRRRGRGREFQGCKVCHLVRVRVRAWRVLMLSRQRSVASRFQGRGYERGERSVASHLQGRGCEPRISRGNGCI
jgi:hypothetical protein